LPATARSSGAMIWEVLTGAGALEVFFARFMSIEPDVWLRGHRSIASHINDGSLRGSELH